MPHYLSLRFANAVRSFGMGLAYSVAAGGQAIAAYVVPAAGHRIGLIGGIELFVVVSTIAAAAVAFRDPDILPGRDMAATGDAAT